MCVRPGTRGGTLFQFISATSILGTIGVGLFFMISGYFAAHKREISIKKVSIITVFYAGIIFIFTTLLYMSGCAWDKGKLIFKWHPCL